MATAVCRFALPLLALLLAAPLAAQEAQEERAGRTATHRGARGDADPGSVHQAQRCGQDPCSAGISLPGRVWAGGKPFWIPDITREDNFPRRLNAATEGLHAAVGFPICTSRRKVGALVIKFNDASK